MLLTEEKDGQAGERTYGPTQGSTNANKPLGMFDFDLPPIALTYYFDFWLRNLFRYFMTRKKVMFHLKITEA